VHWFHWSRGLDLFDPGRARVASAINHRKQLFCTVQVTSEAKLSVDTAETDRDGDAIYRNIRC